MRLLQLNTASSCSAKTGGAMGADARAKSSGTRFPSALCVRPQRSWHRPGGESGYSSGVPTPALAPLPRPAVAHPSGHQRPDLELFSPGEEGFLAAEAGCRRKDGSADDLRVSGVQVGAARQAHRLPAAETSRTKWVHPPARWSAHDTAKEAVWARSRRSRGEVTATGGPAGALTRTPKPSRDRRRTRVTG